MGRRNYCAGYYDQGTGKMNFWIQVEKVQGKKGTVGYLIDVPRLVFGEPGHRLHQTDKYALLQSLANHHPHLVDKVGGFIRPNH